MTVAVSLPSTMLSRTEQDAVSALQSRLMSFQPNNMFKADLYSGKQRLESLGISIPPSLQNMMAVVGWPGTVVDVLEERLNLRGWLSPDGDFGMDEVFAANDLDVEASLAHLDAMIYGTAFIAVSTGLDGEADPLVTVESPTRMTASISPRTRRVTAALASRFDENGNTVGGVLYLPDVTVWFEHTATGWSVLDRDNHKLGRVPVVQLVNRPRSGDLRGRSEITPAIITYTQNAMRTLASAEIAREFFAAPQRYVLGANESFFFTEDGEPRSAWDSYLGRILAIERDGDQLPTVGEFKASSMDPYFNQIRALSQLVASESAIPAHYLGFVTENPASADAIRQAESRLVKRALRRMAMFGRAWTEVARLAVSIRDGGPTPPGLASVRPDWVSPATATSAADADRVVKLIGAGVLSPRSTVTFNELGFTPETQKRLLNEPAPEVG